MCSTARGPARIGTWPLRRKARLMGWPIASVLIACVVVYGIVKVVEIITYYNNRIVHNGREGCDNKADEDTGV
jgi:hypothetical protein